MPSTMSRAESEKGGPARSRIATYLLRIRNDSGRRTLIRKYLAGLVVLFIAHTGFSNLTSPLKLIPQTLFAMAMGYVLLSIISTRQFKYVAEFIDWGKVSAAGRCSECGCELQSEADRCPECRLMLQERQNAP